MELCYNTSLIAGLQLLVVNAGPYISDISLKIVCEMDGEVMFSSHLLMEENLCKPNSIFDRNIM